MSMFKNVAKKLAVGTLAVGALTAGITGAGQVVTAERSDAATWSSCRIVDAGAGYRIVPSAYRYGLYCYVNYSWWEEVTNWNNKDGYKFVMYSPYRSVLASYL